MKTFQFTQDKVEDIIGELRNLISMMEPYYSQGNNQNSAENLIEELEGMLPYTHEEYVAKPYPYYINSVTIGWNYKTGRMGLHLQCKLCEHTEKLGKFIKHLQNEHQIDAGDYLSKRFKNGCDNTLKKVVTQWETKRQFLDQLNDKVHDDI